MGIAAPHNFLAEAEPALAAPSAPALQVRAARSGDAPAILAHYRRMSSEDRALRFCGTISERSLELHADKVASGSPRGLLAVETDAEGERVRGVVELHPDGTTAELAISLESGWRGRGVAETLMRAAGAWCVGEGVARVTAMTLSSNHRMKGLGRKLGARLRPSPDGVDLVFDATALAARPGPAAAQADPLRKLLNARPATTPAAGDRPGPLPAADARAPARG